MLTFLKLAQEEVNVYVAGFFRFLFGFLIIFPYMLKSKFTVFKTNHHKKHFLRAILNLPSMLLYFSALVMMPIEKATAISFVVPFIVTILAVLFLGEKIYIYRSFALVLGFIGMLIITKTIAKDDSSITILSYGYTYMTIFSFIIALFYWQTPSFQTLIYLFFAGLFGTLLHLCINHAYKLVDVSMTQPYSFLSLVFASLIGYYVFSETPDLFTWIGASVIFLGVLIMSYREMKLDKEIIRKRIDIKS